MGTVFAKILARYSRRFCAPRQLDRFSRPRSSFDHYFYCDFRQCHHSSKIYRHFERIGISSRTIEIAYMFQSLFYALAGTIIGIAVLYLVLVPFVDAHPINFPFSDGILVATWSGTLIRAFVLFIATVIAGYIPAKIIVKQNTLDAILGR